MAFGRTSVRAGAYLPDFLINRQIESRGTVVPLETKNAIGRADLYDKLGRELCAMTEEQIVDLFDNYDFVDWRGYPLAQNLPFRVLIRMAVAKTKFVVSAP